MFSFYNIILFILTILLYIIICICKYTEYYDNLIGLSPENINDNRGLLGNFYVDCHKCDRNRILDSDNNKQLRTCTKDKIYNDTEGMRYYSKYIDMGNNCYNCLIDNRLITRNYKDLPSVNGISNTNSFIH